MPRSMPPRLPPIDTSEYISCPIDTPLLDFDQKSPVPCIIVTPSSPTEYHIAFHHKSSRLKQASFSAQQEEQESKARRAFFTALNPFASTPPPTASFDTPPRLIPFKPSTRTAYVLAVPVFIIACHILASLFLRGAALSTLLGGGISHGGFSSAAAHMRAQRDAFPQPIPEPETLPQPLDQPAEFQPLIEPALD